MASRLAGRVALVTGAARGQGRSHAIRLAEEGADIIAVDLCAQLDGVGYPMATADELAETVAAVEALDRRIVARRGDVCSTSDMQSLVADGVAELGRLDIVAANAGIYTSSMTVDMTDDVWDQMIAVNLTGVFKTVRAALPPMIEAGNGGSIILTSSTQGIRGFQNCVHYNAAKHGVVGVMRGVANEVGQYGIRVNTVHPTLCNTPMVQNDVVYRLFEPDNPRADATSMGQFFQEQHLLPTPNGWVEPVDLSNAIVWLASDEARYVTGLQIPVDAGYLAKS